MSAEIRYENSKLLFPEFRCNCGSSHSDPDMDVYIGSGLLKDAPEYIRARHLGKKAVLVADNITYGVAGRAVEKSLKEDGFDITLCLLEREGELDPDEAAVGEVLLSMDRNTEFFVSVGSGSVTDTTRYVAFNTGRPFVCVGTAPSMDGYTSVVAPLLFNGLKINKPACCPKIILCDLDVMRSAPLPMFISGVGDVLGKYIAKADWILGRVVNGEAYCPTCADIVTKAVGKCLDNIEGIKNRTVQGTKDLIEALILAGVTILILGHTRPVASIEHNMAHYWEMMKLAAREKAPSHGTAVGVGTVYSLMLYEAFLKLDLSGPGRNRIKRAAPSRPLREQEMIRCYGRRFGESIMRENPEDFLDQAEQERRIDAIVRGFDGFKAEIGFLPSADEMIRVMKKLGAPVSAAEIGVDRELLAVTLKCSKDYRSRYNVGKTLDELGLLDKCIGEVLKRSV